MPDILFLVLTNFTALLAVMTLLWAISVKIKDASIIDIAWGPACAFPALLTLVRTETTNARAIIITVLVSLWAARLAFHLGVRNLGHGEDYRYQKMRAAQGSDKAFARWSLFYVFWLQASVAWIVSLPVQLGQFGAAGIGVFSYAGIVLFVFGLGFESIGDWQLKRFKANPENQGKLMTTGLWSLTRHPNYFGDAAVWFGLTLIAFDGPFGAWSIISPFVMAYFLISVSGKALTERHMRKKYPEYEAYSKRVSGFLPMPSKSQKPSTN